MLIAGPGRVKVGPRCIALPGNAALHPRRRPGPARRPQGRSAPFGRAVRARGGRSATYMGVCDGCAAAEWPASAAVLGGLERDGEREVAAMAGAALDGEGSAEEFGQLAADGESEA